MKRRIRKFILFILCFICCAILSLGGDVSAAPKPSLNNPKVYLKGTETAVLEVNNKISKAEYEWISSDKTVAIVDKKGKITANNPGEAIITYRYVTGKKTVDLICEVNVIDKNTVYTMTEESVPSDSIRKKSTYNENTKDWYVLNEIMQCCEKGGGGKVIIKKGDYSICRRISIPSNVTMVLEDGVVIKKTSSTGTADLSSTKTMFQLIEPSNAAKKAVYTKYTGVHDVHIIGEGNAIIDLDYEVSAFAFVMAHNLNVSFENVTFKNMNTGHFIELDASKDVTINKCVFTGAIKSPKSNKEAINLDTPDAVTGGFSHDWSSMDKTPVQNITITDCIFDQMDVGIGTHKYSQIQDSDGNYTITMYHENIIVKGCTFSNLYSAGLKMIAWKNVTVEDCTFQGGTDGVYSIAFKANAVDNLSFRNNICKNIGTVGGAYSSEGTSAATASFTYTSIKSHITVENIKDFYTNRCSNVKLPQILLQVDTFEPSDSNVGQKQINRPDLYGNEIKYILVAAIPEEE